MSTDILHALEETDWYSLRDLEDNLDVAQTYLTNRCVAQAAQMNNTARVESRVRKGLKSCCKRLAGDLLQARSELGTSEPRLESLKKKRELCRADRNNALRSMVLNHVKRVRAPLDGDVAEVNESLALGVVTLGASPEAFNEFYEAQRAVRLSLPEWNCSAEAAALPEKDLLGMCPGGKPHLSDEHLERLKTNKCYCSICVADRKLKEAIREIRGLRPRVSALREQIKTQSKMLVSARRLIPRFRSSEFDGAEAEADDPVFYDEEEAFEGADDIVVLSHRRAREAWDTLANTLNVSDFPLRIVFLDKSGSMGCDRVCYDALQLGVHNSLHPHRGSTLTFLFAGPGETQMFLRRPGDAPIQLDLALGCATWFNEPILRTLRFLAPLVERLDTKAYMKEWMEPPLQVLCVTDGADNQSPEEISTLGGLVRELKEIAGPVSGQKLYMPIAGALKKHAVLLNDDSTQVPVWLAWIVCGMGGESLLGSKVPKEICMIDAIAVPQLREPDVVSREEPPCERQEDVDDEGTRDRMQHCASSTAASRARQRKSSITACKGNLSLPIDLQAEWKIGHRVRIRANAVGKAPRAAVVMEVLSEGDKRQYDLLFDDESREVVDSDQLIGAPVDPLSMLRLQPSQSKPKGSQAERGLLARTADPDQQRWQVLDVVNTVTQDLGAIMNVKGSKSKVSLEDAVKLINGREDVSDESVVALENAVNLAQQSYNVSHSRQAPPIEPADLLQDVLVEVGRSSARLAPEDRLVAQKFASVGVEMLLAGGSIMPAHIGDQLAPFVGLQEVMSLRRMRVESEELDEWKKMLCQPLEILLQTLQKKGLLECHATLDGEIASATQEAFSCLTSIWRYVDPSLSSRGFEDSLRRAVNRFQRTRRSFSFSSKVSSNSSSTCREIGSAVPRQSMPLLSLPFGKEDTLNSLISSSGQSMSVTEFTPHQNEDIGYRTSRPSSSASSEEFRCSRQCKDGVIFTTSNRSTTPSSTSRSQRSRSLSLAGSAFLGTL